MPESFFLQKCNFHDVNCSLANCSVLVQQNLGGSVFFNRSWAEFKVGFGNPKGNYWLGNERLSQLTLSGPCKLKFDLQSRNTSDWYTAEYRSFAVLPETDNYRMYVSGYSGDASDSFSSNSGTEFSTYDRDNDQVTYNCAVHTAGGFWHRRCTSADVNSAGTGSHSFGWYNLPGGRDLQTSRMWLQCK